MGRPTKKEINLTKESMLSLMQEIYNELVEQRNTAIRIQNKMLTMMKEPEDMTLIGPVIEKQQKIVNDCVEKKISLSKLQSGIWEKSNNNTESFSMADLDDDIIQNLIDKDVSNDEETSVVLGVNAANKLLYNYHKVNYTENYNDNEIINNNEPTTNNLFNVDRYIFTS